MTWKRLEKYQRGALSTPFEHTPNVSANTSTEPLHRKPEKFKVEQCQKALFNVQFKCIEEGELLPYPAKNRLLLTEEEQELELRYKDNKVYAIGHGVAVDWRKKPTAENGNQFRLHAHC